MHKSAIYDVVEVSGRAKEVTCPWYRHFWRRSGAYGVADVVYEQAHLDRECNAAGTAGNRNCSMSRRN